MVRFSQFFDHWLYDKDGYYAKFRQIGKGGDFYTAVSSSMFFGGSVANRLIKTIQSGFLPNDTTVLEIGAHQGYMIADVVQFIYTLQPKLLESLSFAIVEPFDENVKAQLEYFKSSFGDEVKLKHYNNLDELSLDSAFVFSNELFDAFACEIIKDDKMLFIEDFKPVFKPISDDIKELCLLHDIKNGEVAIGYEEFANKLSCSIDKFEFVTFDYGEKEQREDFSIRVYHKHKSYPFFALTDLVKSENPTLEQLYKKSDITYDVNFTHLIKAFQMHGIKLENYNTQLAMLVEFGIIELLDMLRVNNTQEVYESELNRAKVLIDPSFLGERFKGIVFRRDR